MEWNLSLPLKIEHLLFGMFPRYAHENCTVELRNDFKLEYPEVSFIILVNFELMGLDSSSISLAKVLRKSSISLVSNSFWLVSVD